MKVTKAPKRGPPNPPGSDVTAVVAKISESANDDELITALNDLPSWKYPRGDLHAWISVLDRFDDILADIIQSYDLAKLQTNEFTPKTKELLMGLLRVTRLLLENCTSRRLFASYDRLADLLLTTDLDVLLSTIILLLRPTQQYGTGIPVEGELGTRLANRVLTLTRGWEQFQEAGLDAVQLASLETVTASSTKVNLQYYPEEGSRSSISSLELDSSELETSDQIAEVAERHKIPVDDQLTLLHRARILTTLQNRSTRRALLAIRFLAVATYVYIVSEEVSMSTIFLYETSVIQQLANVMVPNRDVGDWVLSSALYALDACAHHRVKLQEVLTTVGANVSHGILIRFFRDLVNRLTGGGDSTKAEDFLFEVLDAIIGLIAYVATSPPHNNHVVSAGVIPLLLEMPKTLVPRRENYIPRAMGLLDALCTSVPQGMTAITNANGINTLVGAVKAEVELLLANPLQESTYALSEDTIRFSATSPLRTILRLVHRLMTHSSAAEGTRNLVDSSLPKTLKTMFEHAERLDTRNYALAINVMATFVHNEPTSLTILQELQLPQTLYETLEKKYPTSYDVLSTIPTAIGAICLNQTGLDYTLAHPRIVEGLVVASMSNDGQILYLGQYLDELARHHPPLRPLILKSLLGQLHLACEEGAKFVPAEADRRRYLLDATDRAEEIKEVVGNEPLNKLLKVLLVLQGVLRNSALSKDFNEGGGLTMLLDTADLPCIPMHSGYGISPIYGAILNVLQTIGEHDYTEVAKALVDSVTTTMSKVQDLWKNEQAWQSIGGHLVPLRSLGVRLSNLNDFYNNVPSSQHRSGNSLIKVVNDASGGQFLQNAADFHRMTMMISSRLKIKEETESENAADGAKPVEDAESLKPVEDPKGSATKYLSSRLYTGFIKIFKSFIRLLFNKRSVEAPHRTEAQRLSESMTRALIGHCEHGKTLEGPIAAVYDAAALAAILHQLFDDRGHEGHLQMVLFLVFEKRGGVGQLLSLIERVIATMERTDLNTLERARTVAGVTVALNLLAALVRPAAMVSNAQAHALQLRPGEKFNPFEIFVRLRRDAFPLARRVWASEWLPSASPKTAHLAVRTFLTIMAAKDEEPVNNRLVPPPRPQAALGAGIDLFSAPVLRAPTVADPTRVDQLVDMGFARGSAERALVRARNNVAAAADMILSAPHMFEGAETAPPTAAPAAEPAIETPAAVETPSGEAAEPSNAEGGPEQSTAGQSTTATNEQQPNADDSMDIDAEEPPKTPEPIESAETVKKVLDDMRLEERPQMPARALKLLDIGDELLFDLLRAFSTDQAGLGFILKNLHTDNEKYLARRMRLFAIVCSHYNIGDLSDENATMAYDFIRSLPIDQTPRPGWLTALFLFAETVMVLCNNTKDTKIGDPIERVTSIIRMEETERLLVACEGIFADTEATKDELLSAYRCMAIITRTDLKFDFSKCLTPFKHRIDPRLSRCHPGLAMILRHSFEDKPTLEYVMRREIRSHLYKDKTVDIRHFVKQLRHVTARDSDAFVDAMDKECILIDPAPVSQTYHIRPKELEKEAAPDPFQAGTVANPTMDALVLELGHATKATFDDVSASTGYTGLLFSLLTEVTGSYMSAKKSFMETLRLHGLHGQPKAKGGISTIITDLVGCLDLGKVFVQDGPKPQVTKRTVISGWSISLLVALCSDITPTSDIKSVSEDLVTIRRTVLDAIVKVLRDSSAQEPNVRYGKLWAVGELVYRLLNAKPAHSQRQHDESALQLAKLMVEKNLVGLMTEAAGSVDLNFPNIKAPLLSLLRALDHLSKVSIKWNKVEKAKEQGDAMVDEGTAPSSSSDSDSDIDMGEVDEEAPDLYRNSALGILGGEIDADSDGEEDEEDEDDIMEVYGDEIDDDDQDLGTEPSSDEDMTDIEEVMDDEEGWTDEDEVDDNDDEDDDDDDDEGPQVIIGTEDPESIWDVTADEEALLDASDDDEERSALSIEDMETREEFDAFLDGVDGMEGMDMDDMEDMDDEDDEGDALIMEEDEEEEEAFLETLEARAGMEATWHPPSADTSHWGWSNDTRNDRRGRGRSRLMMSDPQLSLFERSRPRDGLADHPLLANPVQTQQRERINIPEMAASDAAGSLEQRMGPEAARLVESILHRSHRSGQRDIRLGFNTAADGGINLQIEGHVYSFPAPDRQQSETPEAPVDIASEFIPKPSSLRWQNEMMISGEDSGKLVNHIINRLLPEAKVRAAAEEAKMKQAEDEAEKKADEKRKADEEAKAQEDAKKAAEPEAAPAQVALPASRVPTPSTDVEMIDVAAPAATAPTSNENADETGALDVPPTGETAQPDVAADDHTSLARTLITIHGREVDITGTGIDLEFLQALPDEMRADVVEQHMREHGRPRQTERAGDTNASQVSPEFLDALPPDIRNEVILQEQLESQRRARAAERLTADNGAAAVAPPAGAPPSDPLHGSAAHLQAMREMIGVRRQRQPAGGLAGMLPRPPPDIFEGLSNELREVFGSVSGLRRPEPVVKKSRRDAVQLLDKPGVASLVRLLFFPEAFKRDYLLRVLVNLCENSSTRIDLLNLLLSVVQDGTGDLPAVDKSFAQLSLKPGTTPKSTPRNVRVPDTPATSQAATALFARLQSDQIPTFIAQRSFEALTHIVASNSQAVIYFLSEHEQPVGLRKAPSKKGKGKEKLIPQTKFPIVVLLDFLDRSLLLKTSGMMESFAALLSAITRPLSNMKKTQEGKAKETEKAGDPTATHPEPAAVAPTSVPEPSVTSVPAAEDFQAVVQRAVEGIFGPRPITVEGGGAISDPLSFAATPSHTTPSRARAMESTAANASAGLTSPPQIPASTLRLVVNLLTIGECTSKTFSHTLAIIQNLSIIPDGKETILDELRIRAQRLGQVIFEELKELDAVLQDQSVEVDATSLVKFSPPSSSQAQLLRLLKTIDYVHSEKVDSDPPGETMTESEQAIGKVFDSFDFEPMWKQLSDCLTLVEERDRTDQISTVLLPLVEALMVICKYRRPEVSRETRSPSLPPASAVESENLFVTFTTTHRKVLNAIVRTNPGLLSGSFSLLVRNPRVLEFDNKRNWFLQKLKRKRDQPVNSPVLHLNIRRQYVFEDSFRALERRAGEEVKYGKLSVKFYNEDGIDAGGVTREWFSVLAQQIFDPNFALFEPCAADQQTYQPNKASSVNGDHLSYFKFVGRVIGKAVFDGRLLDAYFSRAFYKQILGKTVDMRDLESIDPEYHKSLQWMLDNDITDVIDQEFTIEDDQFGEKKVVELKEGGEKIPVTEENKAEYVRLVVSYRIENSIKDQIKAFLNGFYEIIPRNLIQIFEPDQLELLISGITNIDVDELKNSTQMAGWKGGDPEIAWFWRALRSFSQEERARFLMFVTSSSRVPLGGFTQLIGASGVQPFQIQKLYSKEGSLPQASTCFNLLLLPKYESYEQLRERLQFAVYETSGFGKA